jgi:outer membrane biosynthesis protein TonB
MYLAGILGLCALLHVSSSGSVGSGAISFALQDAQPAQSQPSPAEPVAPKPQPEQAEPKPEQAPSETPNAQPQAKPSATQKHSPSKKRPSTKKKKTVDPANQDPKKTVVRHGSTEEPTTQLAPGITEEQAAQQRETTTQLLSSTDAALQKLDTNQLTSDQKDTIGQIRKFMEQAKAADAEGDPQRSYKLALKAHLLTDALGKQ